MLNDDDDLAWLLIYATIGVIALISFAFTWGTLYMFTSAFVTVAMIMLCCARYRIMQIVLKDRERNKLP